MRTKSDHQDQDILLVEDSSADIFLVKQAIQAHGLPVNLQVAEDGERAIEFIDRAESEPDTPSPKAVLLDLNLPKKTGADVLMRLRRSNKFRDVPIIIVTSSGSDRDREQMKRLGATRYFQKPSAFDDFLKLGAVLAEVLETTPWADCEKRSMTFTKCETCNKLINAYEAAVTAYAHACETLSCLMKDDFNQAWDKCEKRRHACRSASEELLEHVRSNHGILRQRS